MISGAHSQLKGPASSLYPNALELATVNKIDISPDFSEFWRSENLGVLPQKRCDRCLSCNACTDPGLIHSRREQEELDALKEGIKLVDGTLQVRYQFKKDPRSLPNNRNAAMKIAEKLEQRLTKEMKRDYYNQQFQELLDRGAVVKLSKEELESWQGPINYISHHGVEQDSVTTPLRIVSNSSLKNGGKSLNDCLITGPKSLNSMFDIMQRFRCYECGLVYDLSKAYNQLKTGPVERHLRRIIWRFSVNEPWVDYAFNDVHFGDTPAANFLEIGRNLTADAGKEIDQVASKKIKGDTYVDDGITGGSNEQVEKMKGERLEDGSYTGTLAQIFKKGKLKMKVIITTGETDEALKHLIGNKVLGYNWNATSDEMSVSLPVNITPKKNKKLRSGPDLTMESLGLLKDVKFTKRLCLGITNGFHDFLGIACPFILRFKLLIKELFSNKELNLDWDTVLLDDSQRAEWIKLITLAVQSQSICFPRTTRPKDAIGNPDIASFADGSFEAFCAAVYIRWQVNCRHISESECTGDYVANLLCAKAKVTPMEGLSIPRVELSGQVLETRLTLSTVRALSCEDSLRPTGVVMMNDSECSIAAIEKSTSSLKPFFHNRVSEILENINMMKKYCPVEDIQHIVGSLNPSDLGTRGRAKPSDLGNDSFWQQGPTFLRLRRDLWPTSRDFLDRAVPVAKDLVPKEEIRNRKTVICAAVRAFVKDPMQKMPAVWVAINRILNYSDSLVKVRRILARVIRCWKAGKKDLNNMVKIDPVATEIAEAEQLMLVVSMPETASAAEKGLLVSLQPQMQGKLIVTTGRLGGDCLKANLGVSALTILMPSTRVAYLYMVLAHIGEHGTEHKSIVETLARSRHYVWIHRGRDLAKKVCKRCLNCIKRKKALLQQRMAKVRPERLVVCPPWTHVSLDFAGPIKIKGVVNARARIRCWVLIYVCCSTKAVCLLACCGYSTQAFLLRHEEFVARVGAPKTLVSDRGTQLVSAGTIIARKESPENWDWNKVVRDNTATSWEFVPVGSQHRNGLPEATVRVLKRSLLHAIHPGVILSYDELVTVLARISYSINQRPLGLANTSQNSQQDEQLQPLTPNMMLLGRNSNQSPPLDYNPDERFSSRLAYVASVESSWWEKWIKEVMPTLLPLQRWKIVHENLKVGDIVHLWYEGNIKDDYRLARVIEVFPDEQNLVRTVRVKYRKTNKREAANVCRKSSFVEEKVAIQRLSFVLSPHYSELLQEDD